MTKFQPYNLGTPLFDKNRLKSDEFKKHIYERKYRQKRVKDMRASGYIYAINPYLKGIDSDILKWEDIPGTGREIGGTRLKPARRVVIKVTVTAVFLHSTEYSGSYQKNDPQQIVVSAIATGVTTEFDDPEILERAVETRALKRAIARILAISTADLNDVDTEEEETETPVWNPPKLRRNESARRPMQEIADKAERDGSEPEPEPGDSDEDWDI